MSPIQLALSCEIDSEIAAVLCAKMALPHQLNPPPEWGAIEYLTALRFGALAGFSDGRSDLDDLVPGLPSDGRWFVHAVADQGQLLVLDLRAGNRADVHIGG